MVLLSRCSTQLYGSVAGLTCNCLTYMRIEVELASRRSPTGASLGLQGSATGGQARSQNAAAWRHRCSGAQRGADIERCVRFRACSATHKPNIDSGVAVGGLPIYPWEPHACHSEGYDMRSYVIRGHVVT